ncbi:type I restriction-modification system DNA methylase subunit [Micromonospora kangleipakensis]|uniref:Type I restriction-modification system DNA methylase subunit n=1 Tax=Micromonospora kangleipakensis TaxID=1077942 RepID=A0A4Q8BDW4_9ACTN|nr:N-6 DNA methylase [Micromonospora kangleipakensis]RZU75505.1 type I restriction-modification system DNA methylase subunit [Micromonospora kangleipakensis]
MLGSDGATVATGDIARLAGVGRAAVSNWRRRFPDFPQPVGGSSASPLFAVGEVEAWLSRHDKPFRLTPVDRVWQSLRGSASDLELGDRIGNLGGFLVFLERDPAGWKTLAEQPDAVVEDRLAEAIRTVVPEFGHLITDVPAPDTVAIVRLAAEAADREGPRAVFDFLCERYLEVHSRRHTVTPAAFASVMVALAASEAETILDPACGIGTLLLAAAGRSVQELRGQEVNRTPARIASARLLLHARDARVTVSDSLRSDVYPGALFDAVVCNPPFADRSWGHDELAGDARWEYGLPPRGEPELAWVQHCLRHVKPGGRVAVLMPAAAASRRSGRRIRSNLLRAGVLRAVICLPPTGPTGAVAPDLWLMRRPDGTRRPDEVFMVDASSEPAHAIQAWAAFSAGSELPAGSRAVPIIDLLDDDVDLAPARHLAAAGRPSSAFPPALASLCAAVDALVPTLPDLTDIPSPDAPVMTTIGELVRTGAVTIRQAPMKMGTDEDGPTPVLTARDVRLGRPASGTAVDLPGAVTLRAGDVVTPLAPRAPAVHVVTDGGPLLGPRLYLLRVDPEQLDPYFLAGFLRTAQRGGSSGSSLAGRLDIRRTRIPRLPLSEQRSIGEAFRRLMAFEARLRKATALGEELVERGFVGLGDGSLRPATVAD